MASLWFLFSFSAFDSTAIKLGINPRLNPIHQLRRKILFDQQKSRPIWPTNTRLSHFSIEKWLNLSIQSIQSHQSEGEQPTRYFFHSGYCLFPFLKNINRLDNDADYDEFLRLISFAFCLAEMSIVSLADTRSYSVKSLLDYSSPGPRVKLAQ